MRLDARWAVEQVAEKYPEGDPIAQGLNWLIECWTSVEASEADLDRLGSEFRLLLDRIPLAPYDPTVDRAEPPLPRRTWAPGPQWAEVGRIGRVRPDLMVRDGWKLNGRVGDIVGVRRGDVILVFHREVQGGPPEHRGPASDFEVDITDIT